MQKNSLMKLLKIVPLLLLVAFLSSCSKEESIDSGSGNGNPSSGSGIQGTWKLVSSSGTTGFSSTQDDAGNEIKMEAILKYTSQNPVGVYNITAASFKSVGIGYDYIGKLTMLSYENNVLQLEDSIDLNTTIPPTSAETKYKLIGNDSIYFEAGTLTSPSAPGSPTTTIPAGCKYKLEGNRLTFFMKMNMPQIINQGGITVKFTQYVDVSIVLQKQ